MRASEENLTIFQRLLLVIGFDGEGENKEGEEESESETDEEPEDEESEDEEESEEEDSKDTAKLTKALREERKARRQFERDLKKLQRQQERAKNKETSDADQARKDAEESQGKTVRLAAKLRDTAVDNVVTKLATKMKFRDVDDALRLIDRAEIDVEQDEDEPDKVEIDETSVNDALKALAKKKPHLLIAAGDGDPSGGNLGSRSKDKNQVDEAALKDLYPALRR